MLVHLSNYTLGDQIVDFELQLIFDMDGTFARWVNEWFGIILDMQFCLSGKMSQFVELLWVLLLQVFDAVDVCWLLHVPILLQDWSEVGFLCKHSNLFVRLCRDNIGIDCDKIQSFQQQPGQAHQPRRTWLSSSHLTCAGISYRVFPCIVSPHHCMRLV